jgi:probable rRNA maturation factor
LASAQVAVGLRGEVEVLLASDKTLRRLNREWRGKDKATDVLSFPAAEEMAAVYGGDLAVSLETAQRQAEQHGHSLRDEVRILLLHGLLHLSGMDHEADAGEMAEREAELRKRLRLKSGLIARAGKHTSGAKASGYPKASSRPRGKSRFPAGMTNKKRMTKKQVAA